MRAGRSPSDRDRFRTCPRLWVGIRPVPTAARGTGFPDACVLDEGVGVGEGDRLVFWPSDAVEKKSKPLWKIHEKKERTVKSL